MLISTDDVIIDRPAVDVREAVRQMRHVAFSARALGERLGIDAGEAEALVADLNDAGFIEPCDHGASRYSHEDPHGRDRPPVWITTIAGNALAKARIGKPMSAETAQRLLDGVLDRVRTANASQEWLHDIERVVLYGSFARRDTDTFGDIDIAVWLRPRYSTDHELRTKQDEMIERDGARPSDLLAHLTYAQRRLTSYVRSRSPRVDLVDHTGDRREPPGPVVLTVYP